MDVDEYMKILDEQYEKANIKSILTPEQLNQMRESCRNNFIQHNSKKEPEPEPVVIPAVEALLDEPLENL